MADEVRPIDDLQAAVNRYVGTMIRTISGGDYTGLWALTDENVQVISAINDLNRALYALEAQDNLATFQAEQRG